MNIFDAPVAEFKTKAAAKKFSKRVIGSTKIIRAKKSFYDPLNNSPVYQVILISST